jgi:hypothetical protein
VFEYPEDGVTAETLRSLARDAVARYATAFGGRPEFLAALAGAKKRADLTNARATILREAVQQIGRETAALGRSPSSDLPRRGFVTEVRRRLP